MAGEPNDDATDDVLLLDDPLPDDATDDTGGDDGNEAAPGATEDADDEFAVEFEGEEPPAEVTPLVRTLRQQVRDRDRELSEYRKQAQPADPGEEPTLEGADWDEDKFKAAWRKWNDAKAEQARRKSEAEQARDVENRELQRIHDNYRAKAAALPVKDYAAAEKAVAETLTDTQQKALVAYTDDPAKLVYALSRSTLR